MSSDLRGDLDFLFFWGKGEKGKGFGGGECKLGILGVCKLPASYQQVRGGGSIGGIKVEFGGFIGGFGKIFFTKGGIKREKEGFWRDGRAKLYFFKIF